MDVRYHLLRDLVANKTIHVDYRPTEQMTADILTKPLDSKLFLLSTVFNPCYEQFVNIDNYNRIGGL